MSKKALIDWYKVFGFTQISGGLLIRRPRAPVVAGGA